MRGGGNLYTLKNGTLLKVTEVSQGQYEDSNGDSVDKKDILIISKMNDSLAFGKGATSSGASMALGYQAKADGGASIAFGAKSKTKENNSIAIGTRAMATKEQSIAIGAYANALETESIAIGVGSNSKGAGAISLGYLSQTNSDGSIAIGDKAETHHKEGPGTSIGYGAKNYGYGSMAIGTSSRAFSHSAVAVGDLSQTGDESLKDLTLNNYMLSVNEYNNLSKDKKDLYELNDRALSYINPNSNKTEYYQKGTVYFLKNKWQTAIGEHSWAKGYEATALGANSKAFGHYSLAIGIASQSKAKHSSAIGYESEADGEQSIALGYKAKAIDTNSTAIGYKASAQKSNSVAIGTNATASSHSSVAIGENAKAESGYNVSIGKGAFSKGASSIAIGENSKSQDYSIAIGDGAEAKNRHSVAMGFGAIANNLSSVAIGFGAESFNEFSVSVGRSSKAGYNSVAIGDMAKASKSSAVAVGGSANAEGEFSAALGANTIAKGIVSNAFGYEANATGNFSTAIGSYSTAKEENSLALGVASQANINNSVALGSFSVANRDSGVAGFDFEKNVTSTKDNHIWTSKLGAVSVGDADKKLTRQITNVAAGTKDTDAVNVAQLKSLRDYSDKTFAKQTDLDKITDNLDGKISNIKAGDKNIVVETEADNSKKISLAKDLTGLQSAEFNKYENGKAVADADKTTINNETIEIGNNDIKANISKNQIVLSNNNQDITIKNDGKDQNILGLSNTKWNGKAEDKSRAATEGQLEQLQENFTKNLNGTVNQTLGNYNLAGNTGNHKLYDNNKTLTIKGDDKENIITEATADGNLNITLSPKLNLTKDGSIKFDKTTLDENGLKVGDDKVKITEKGVTIKTDDPNKPVELTQNGLNNGGNIITNVKDGVADSDVATVGQIKNIKAGTTSIKESINKEKWAEDKPKATGKNSLSIGGGSTDSGRDNTVSVGTPGHERTISNVANPVKGTDAVNLNYLNSRLADVYGQMKNIKDESRAGSASAIAIGGILQATIPGKNVVSISGGNYENQNAVAFGVSGISSDGQWLYKAGGSYDTQNNHGFQVSVGFQF